MLCEFTELYTGYKLHLTQGAGDILALGTPSPTFSAVGAKGTALITEVDAGTRDAICLELACVRAVHEVHTKLIIAFGLLGDRVCVG